MDLISSIRPVGSFGWGGENRVISSSEFSLFSYGICFWREFFAYISRLAEANPKRAFTGTQHYNYDSFYHDIA